MLRCAVSNRRDVMPYTKRSRMRYAVWIRIKRCHVALRVRFPRILRECLGVPVLVNVSGRIRLEMYTEARLLGPLLENGPQRQMLVA